MRNKEQFCVASLLLVYLLTLSQLSQSSVEARATRGHFRNERAIVDEEEMEIPGERTDGSRYNSMRTISYANDESEEDSLYDEQVAASRSSGLDANEQAEEEGMVKNKEESPFKEKVEKMFDFKDMESDSHSRSDLAGNEEEEGASRDDAPGAKDLGSDTKTTSSPANSGSSNQSTGNSSSDTSSTSDDSSSETSIKKTKSYSSEKKSTKNFSSSSSEMNETDEQQDSS